MRVHLANVIAGNFVEVFVDLAFDDTHLAGRLGARLLVLQDEVLIVQDFVVGGLDKVVNEIKIEK